MSEPPQNQTPTITIRISSDSDHSPLDVGFGRGEKSWPPVRNTSPTLTPSALETEMVGLRDKLSTWAKRYEDLLESKATDPLKCDAAGLVREMWKDLAEWGNWLYRQLFHRESSDLVEWSVKLKALKGCRLVIDSAIGGIPWGLLYDEKVPDELPDNYVEEMIEHFWLTSYRLEMLPDYPRDRFLWVPQLDDRNGTGLTVTVNKYIDDNEGSQQIGFFTDVAGRSVSGAGTKPVRPFRININKVELIESIVCKEEPQHLVYFFCHHQKADGTFKQQGWRYYGDSKMILEGKNATPETAISLKEMDRNGKIESFKFPPVVFMNACESSQIEIGDPTSFMIYFINSLKAWAFIGTEAQIPTRFADDFGKRFVREFLKRQPIGEVLFTARRDYAVQYFNPFGLYYTLYGDGNVSLANEVKEATE
ncbi:MAG TPA: hypothetical protein VHE60_06690 [Pyrinomonadaceae bacterium]|nr:hypothetical protein [Pyrinomonadaceae bacterium]